MDSPNAMRYGDNGRDTDLQFPGRGARRERGPTRVGGGLSGHTDAYRELTSGFQAFPETAEWDSQRSPLPVRDVRREELDRSERFSVAPGPCGERETHPSSSLWVAVNVDTALDLIPLDPSLVHYYYATAHYEGDVPREIEARRTPAVRANTSATDGTRENCVLHQRTRVPYRPEEEFVMVSIYDTSPVGDTFMGMSTIPLDDPRLVTTSPWQLVRNGEQSGTLMLNVQLPDVPIPVREKNQESIVWQTRTPPPPPALGLQSPCMSGPLVPATTITMQFHRGWVPGGWPPLQPTPCPRPALYPRPAPQLGWGAPLGPQLNQPLLIFPATPQNMYRSW
mmetsp:Transcript_24794/g.65085  ORF Transcript_24794/g.65085 Transcript_24794/m.65085 type:complete len:337 (-) Transcript_24794:183-1193(-)